MPVTRSQTRACAFLEELSDVSEEVWEAYLHYLINREWNG